MGVYPSAGPLSLGLCGYAGSQYANMAIHNSDLLIGIGTTFHVRQTGSLPEQTAPGAKIARIDIDAGELAHSRVPLDLKIDADAREAVAALNALVGSGSAASGRTDAWLATIGKWKTEHPLCVGPRGLALKPQDIIAAADRITSGETTDRHHRRRPASNLGPAPFQLRQPEAPPSDLFGSRNHGL